MSPSGLAGLTRWVEPNGMLTLEARKWVDGVSQAVRPEDFTRGSDGENIAQAIQAGIDEKAPIRIDGDYSVSEPLSTVAMTAGTLAITGNGLITIAADFSTPAINLHATYPTPVSVSAVTQTTRSFPGTSTTACDATKITAAGHSIAIGDLFKIVSDDLLPITQDPNPRCGEQVYAADVSGNDIYVAGFLLNTYTTNVRVVRVRREARLIWDGPRFAATPAQNWNSLIFLQARGFYRPEITTICEDGYDIGVNVSSCYMAQLKVTGRNMRNRINSEGSSGYLVQDSASAYTHAEINGVDARHGFTTDSPNPSTGDEPYLYGQSYGFRVTGAFVASSSAAFDTHPEAVGGTFHNLVTGGSRLGEAASGAAIQLRGVGHVVDGGLDRGSVNGIQFTATVEGGCVDCKVINWDYDGAGDAIRVGDGTTPNVTRPLVSGGRYRTTKNRIFALWDCDGGIIEGVTLVPVGSSGGTTGISLLGDAHVLVLGLRIDLSGFTGTNFRGLALSGLSNEVTLVRPRLIGGAGKFQAWVNGGSTSGSVTIIDPQSDAAPSGGIIINGGSLSSQSILGANKLQSFAVAGLPAASAEGAGTMVYTTNGDSGAACMAISDGTDWKRIVLGATVSAS